MKKRVLLGAVAFGLLLLSAADWPEDPPSFRDVLRGKVGQKCDYDYPVLNRTRDWILVFPDAGDGGDSNQLTIVGVGTDFVQVRRHNGIEIYVPLDRVQLEIRPQ